MTISHSTITDNQGPASMGGGIASRVANTQTKLRASIVANNASGDDVQFFDGATNPFVSQGYNLIGFGNAATGPMNAFIQTGDHGRRRSHAELNWRTMAARRRRTCRCRAARPSNAGPSPAMPMACRSSISAGFPFIRAFNHDAMSGTQLDIGAVEVQTIANLTLVVDTLVDEYDGNFSAGDLSLREAIGLANGSRGTNTITFAAALTSGGPATILLTRGEFQILEPLTLMVLGLLG